MTISIATKPRTTRTAKGLFLSGAKSQKARHDNCQRPHYSQCESWPAKRPILDARESIAESLEAGTLNLRPAKPQHIGEPRPAYTTESIGFQCLPVPVSPKQRELPQFDEAGRRIVYVGERCVSAWNQRQRR